MNTLVGSAIGRLGQNYRENMIELQGVTSVQLAGQNTREH
jgi:hypothetical protein